MSFEAQPVFYYDLANPSCYLIAEQIVAGLPVVPEWEPVRERWPPGAGPEIDREEIEREAAALGLPPVRWPASWPPDSDFAMLAATYAKRIGRAVAFSLAAFRQAFAAGRDLGDRDTVLLAGAACEMHPAALLKGAGLRSVTEALQDAQTRARATGVTALPAIEIRGEVLQGPEAVDRAVSALEALA